MNDAGQRAAMKRIAKFIGTMVLMSQQRGSFEMTNLSPARPRYSPARRIPLGPSGDLLFLSGIICHDDDARDNIEEQTRRIFARVAAVLKDHNAAITDIVKTTSYLTDLADYDGFNRVRVEIFIDCKEPPASTAVGAGSLLGQGTRLEVDVIALVPHICAAG